MQDIVSFVKKYFKEEFSLGFFITITSFLSFLLVVNYIFQFEKNFVRHSNRAYQVIHYFFFYGIPFCISIIAYGYFYKKTWFLKKANFWFLALFVLIILSLTKSSYLRFTNIKDIVPLGLSVWVLKSSQSIHVFLLWFCIPTIYWYLVDRKKVEFYGLLKKKLKLYPYFLFVLVSFPFVFLASFSEDFSRVYPIYKTHFAADYLEVSPIYPILAFELCYAFAFVATEFLFRGFMLFTLEKYMGKQVLLPMVVLYCMIHFQKPLLEAITSIFGGFILGIIALYSRSIFGGIIAHIGIAWSMDLVGYYQLYVKDDVNMI